MSDKDPHLLNELRSTLSKMELSLNAIDDCIILVDKNGIINWSNRNFSQLTNEKCVEILGEPIDKFLHLADQNNTMLNWSELLKNTALNKKICKIKDANFIKFIEVSVHHFHQSDEENNLVIVLHDVTDNYFTQVKLKDANDDLQYANDELAKSALLKSKLAAIVECTEDAIIGRTLDGIIESWNKGAERLYGYKAEEVLGKSVSFIYPPNKQEEFYYATERAKTGEPFKLSDTERLHKDGHLIAVSVIMSPIRNKEGKIIGSCSIARDISELKKIMNLKNDFISIVSHELRTPLTSIQGSLDLLVAGSIGELPQNALKLLKIAKSNTERLVRLINDILDIQKIESGKMEFNLKPINIDTLIREAVIANQGYAEQFNIQIKLLEKNTAIIDVDRDKILQVLANLISNAIKFSTGDEITVCLYKKDNNMRVEVINKGLEIPKEFHSRIFQKFSQAEDLTSPLRKGTGLGLSISKEIIEKHEGKIGFKSEGNETTFFFELPIYTKAHAE